MTLTIRLLLVLLVLTFSLFGDDKKIAPDAGKSSTIIVQFSNEPDSALQARLASLGAKLKQYMGNLKAGVYEVPAGRATLTQIGKEAQVEYISPDRPVAGYLDHGVSSIYADYRSTGYATGASVGVAVLDSGLNSTEDLDSEGRFVVRIDMTGGANPNDQYGHGTHVASIIAGSGQSSSGDKYFRTFRGVAPLAHIISLKVLDGKGMGTESAVIRAIDTAIALKNMFNIKVMNMSLGRPVLESYKTDPMCKAVEKAWKAGITVVVAAGNEGRNNLAQTNGYGMIMSPANDPYVITVGAMKDLADNGSRIDDRIASYSSKGPSAVDYVVKPDLVAPGNMILADAARDSYLWNSAPDSMKVKRNLYEYTNSNAFSNDYIRLSGTSMAAAFVSGAAAQMASRDRDASPDTIKARMMKTAYKNFPTSSTTIDPATGKKYVSTYDIFTVGAGYIDVQKALLSREEVKGQHSAASPTAQVNKRNGKVTIVYGQNIIWGGEDQEAAWASNIIWGGDEIQGNNIIWGGDENAVWGDSTVGGFNIIWGDNIIWGGDENGWGSESLRTSNIIWGGLVDDDVTTGGDPN